MDGSKNGNRGFLCSLSSNFFICLFVCVGCACMYVSCVHVDDMDAFREFPFLICGIFIFDNRYNIFLRALFGNNSDAVEEEYPARRYDHRLFKIP